MLQSFVLACYRYFFMRRSYWIIYFINLRGTLGMICSSLMQLFYYSWQELGTKIEFWVTVRNRTSDLWFPRSDALPLNHRDCTVKQGMQAWVTCRPEWHASFVQLGTSMSKALCVSILEIWYILSLTKSFLGPRLFSLSRVVLMRRKTIFALIK